MQKDQSCRTCIHVKRIPMDIQKGECRFGPPTVNQFPVQGPTGAGGSIKLCGYPVVALGDSGCSKYVPNFDVAPDA